MDKRAKVKWRRRLPMVKAIGMTAVAAALAAYVFGWMLPDYKRKMRELNKKELVDKAKDRAREDARTKHLMDMFNINPENQEIAEEITRRTGKIPRLYYDDPLQRRPPYKVEWIDLPTNSLREIKTSPHARPIAPYTPLSSAKKRVPFNSALPQKTYGAKALARTRRRGR